MSDEQATAQETALAARQVEVDKKNEERKVDGKFPKGTLLRMGQTRGRNPQIVVWEAFDESRPETLPKTLSEFMDLSKLSLNDEATLVSYLTDGYNSAQYTAASDPVAEFVEASWPEDIQKNFRMAVKNYAASANCSLQDASDLIKPGINRAFEAKKVATEVAPG